MINQLVAIFWKDLQSAASYRMGFILQFGAPVIMVFSFFFLARFLGDAAIPGLSNYGGDYFSFALLGILFTTYAGIFLSSVSSTIRQGQSVGTLEQILTTRTGIGTYLAGSSLYALLRGTITMAGFLAVGVLLLGAELKGNNIPVGALILFLSMVIMLGLGLISGSFILVYKQRDPFTLLIGAGSFLLSGAIYPVSVLPGWLQVGSWALPHTYALEALRLTLLQGAPWSQVAPQIGTLILFAVGILSVSLLFFQHAMRRARIEGSLAQY